MGKNVLFTDALGSCLEESALQLLLQDIGFSAPVLPESDDDTAYLIDEARGLELTFTDEDWLEPEEILRDYPAGAWVLSNIRFYGQDGGDFRQYRGELPFALVFGASAREVEALLGRPADGVFDGGSLLRWDQQAYCLFCEFDEDRLVEVALQLPVPADMK